MNETIDQHLINFALWFIHNAHWITIAVSAATVVLVADWVKSDAKILNK
jgi:hypothetical protein